MAIEHTYTNDDGETISVSLPTHCEVCPDCEGSGFVLCAGMRGHAYTSDEFAEFEQDEQAEYFKRGGRYDVRCDTCNGRNVIDVVDEDRLSAEQRTHWIAICEAERSLADYNACVRAERAMGA